MSKSGTYDVVLCEGPAYQGKLPLERENETAWKQVLINVMIKELPSTKTSLFNSKISEKIKSSKTLVKSVNLITPYELPFAVFLSVIFKSVAAIFASFIVSSRLNFA